MTQHFLPKFSGSKGETSDVSRETDTLFSTDSVEIVLGISEGPIKGLADGDKSFFVGDTPLRNSNGEKNFDEYILRVQKGSLAGTDIKPILGGFGSSTDVNVPLATDIPVVRQGTHRNIDFIDIRMVVSRLIKQTSTAVKDEKVKFQIEYKRASSSTWLKPKRFDQLPETPFDSADVSENSGQRAAPAVSANRGDYYVLLQATPPAGGFDRFWFNSSLNNKPYFWNGTTWQTNAVFHPESALVPNPNYWTWTAYGRSFTCSLVSQLKIDYQNAASPYATTYHYRVTSTNGVIFFNGSSWINAGTSRNPAQDSGGVETDGRITIKGKITSPYVHEFRIPVPRVDDVYDIRITKYTQPNTAERFADIAWESFQELSKEPLNHPGLATAQFFARSSDQLSSMPELSGVYDGRIVKVPNNYDTTNHTYTGVWDGTWKLAWTDNPAYIALDLAENTRYGISAYYDMTINKWDVYDAGVWCDQKNSKGRRRFTFNGLIQDPQNGREILNYICGTFGGRFFDDGNGSGVIKLDMDTPAAALFTAENVEDGVFTYSWTDTASRYNDITVTFVNPDLNWQTDRRRVFDQTHIDKYNRIPLNFMAVGCTNDEEAIARARYKLITGTVETKIVSFRTNRQATYVGPYEIILVADDEVSESITGRILAKTSNTTVTLRDPVYLEPGFTYELIFQVPNTATGLFSVVECRLNSSNVGNARTSLNVSSTTPLPANLPENAVFTIRTTTGSVAPRPYRVTRIAPVDGNSDAVEVTAVEVNRLKWAYVDGVLPTYDSVIDYKVPLRKKPAGVPEIRIRSVLSARKRMLMFDWDPSPSQLVQKYRLYKSMDGGGYSLLTETNALSFEWENPPVGDYIFKITAIAVDERESRPTFIEHKIIGDAREGFGPASLRMVDEPSATIFESRSPRFEWGGSRDPEHDEYLVEVRHPTTNALIHSEFTQNRSFTYEFEVNKVENNGTPRRAFKFLVADVNTTGQYSDFLEISVSNPSPAALTGQAVTQVDKTAVLTYDIPPIKDFVGVMVHQGTNGFVPNEANLVYKGPANRIILPAVPGATTRYRIGAYDVFGDTGITYGAQLSLAATNFDLPDSTPPQLPTNVSAQDGVNSLIVNWTDPPDADLERIEIYYAPTNSSVNAVLKVSAIRGMGSAIVPNIPPGPGLHYLFLRSVDKTGNRSGFTSPGVSARSIGIPSDLFADGSVTSIKIANAAIGAAQLADAAVTDLKLAAGAVSAAKIALGAVTSDKIADAALTTAKFASGLRPVEIVSSLPTTGLTTGRVVFHTGNGKLYRYNGTAWTASTLASDITGTLQAAQIASLAATQITGQITSTQISDNAISTPKILAGAITAGTIAAGAIQAGSIAANAITAGKIAADAITARELAADSVTAGAISAGAVRADEIAADAITATKIAANAVTAQSIAANAVTAEKITAGAITAVKIDTAAVTTEKLAANSVAAGKIAAGAITAREIVITDFTNLIPNGFFLAGTNHSWANWDPAWSVVARNANAGANAVRNIPGPYAVQIADDGTQATSNPFTTLEVNPGDEFYLQFDYAGGGTSLNFNLVAIISWRDADGQQIGSTVTRTVNVSSVGWLTTAFARLLAPAGAARMNLAIRRESGGSGVGFFTNLLLRLRANGNLIVDGAITAIKIEANAITASKILAGAVTADKIAANAVTADKINVNNLSAISANLGSIMVTNANIENLTVGNSKITGNAVTRSFRVFSKGEYDPGSARGEWITAAQFTVNRRAGSIMELTGAFGWLNGASGGNNAQLRFRRGSTELNTFPGVEDSAAGYELYMWQDTADLDGLYTYTMEIYVPPNHFTSYRWTDRLFFGIETSK